MSHPGHTELKWYTYNQLSGYVIGVTDESWEPNHSNFIFYPRPSSVTYEDKKNWRIRHSGTKQHPKARNRGRDNTKYTIKGKMARSSMAILRNMALNDSRSWRLDSPYLLQEIPSEPGYPDKPVVAITRLSTIWAGGDNKEGWIGESGEYLSYTLILERILPNVSMHYKEV